MGRHSAPSPAASYPPALPISIGPRHARPAADRTSGRRRVAVPGPLAGSAPQSFARHRAASSPVLPALPGRAEPARHRAVEPALPNRAVEPALPNRAVEPALPNRAVEPALPNRAPLWRRSPVVPAAVAVLAVWSGANAPRLLPAGHAGPVSQAAGAPLELSGLVAGSVESDSAVDSTTVSAAARLAQADRRVSRASRTLPGPRADLAAPLRSAVLKPAAKPAKPAARWVRPSVGPESSCFCMRWGVMHEGIDLAGPLGSPIVAVGDGVVVEAGPANGFGLWVVIRHANGDYSIYGHMYTYYVTVGQHVRAGQHIADIGANGQSTGPHLHFGIARGSAFGPYLDPIPWLAARGVAIGPYNPDA